MRTITWTSRFFITAAFGVLLVAAIAAQSPGPFYVRADATGAKNGADWTNAYTALPETLVRGATYYIADGTYDGYTFNDSGTSVITIKKATGGDHGTNTGWTSSYGDGQALFTAPLDFETSNYTVDGNTGVLGSYGFAVRARSTVTNIDIGAGSSASVNNLVFRDITVNADGIAGGRGIKIHVADNLLFENVETWNVDSDVVSIEAATDVIFDHCYFHTRNNAGVGTHADAFEIWGGGNNIIRFSRVSFDGQQVFWGGNFTHGRWDIYGNVFYGGPTSGKGLHAHSTNPSINPIYVYNNTFANLNIGMTLGSNTKGEIKNNMFYKLGAAPAFGGTVHDFNWFQSGLSTSGERNAEFGSNPFMNATGNDYRLVMPTASGIALAVPFNMDSFGRIRGADGVWDRGAYECASCSTAPLPAPDAPTNVRVIR